MKRPLVIIGSGHAAYTLIREFRQRDGNTPIVVLTENGGEDYAKPQLSHGFSGRQAARQFVRETAPQIAAANKVMVRPHTRVSAIDFNAQIVIAGELRIPYGQLVLAVGAAPFIPPVSGDGTGKILTLNSLDEYHHYYQALENSQHVMVIGGGLIGTEIAHDLERHRKVTLVDISDRLLPNLVPRSVSERLKQTMKDVEFRFNTSIKTIHQDGQALHVTMQDGESLMVSTVVCAAGLKPRLELAAGLETNRGIVVDAMLQTSRPHVYALGDCAEIEGKVMPFLQPITMSAQALAKTLTGQPTAVDFGILTVAVKTPRYPIQLGGLTAGDHLSWEIQEDEAGVSALALDEGRYVGYVASGSHNGFLLRKAMMESRLDFVHA